MLIVFLIIKGRANICDINYNANVQHNSNNNDIDET